MGNELSRVKVETKHKSSQKLASIQESNNERIKKANTCNKNIAEGAKYTQFDGDTDIEQSDNKSEIGVRTEDTIKDVKKKRPHSMYENRMLVRGEDEIITISTVKSNQASKDQKCEEGEIKWREERDDERLRRLDIQPILPRQGKMSFSERIFFGATGLGGGYVNRNHRNDKSGWKGKGSERERVQDESSEVLYEICKKSKELVVQSSMKVCEKQEELVNEIRKVEKQMEESRKRAEKINKQVRMEMELSYRLKSIGRVAEESYEAMNGIFESMERLEKMLPKRLQLMEGDTEGQKRYGRLVESMTARRYKGVGSKEKEEMRKHKTMGEYVKKIEKKVDEDENELEENIEFDRREESERKGERAYEEKAEVDGKTLGLAAHTQFKWGLIGRAASPLGDYRDYKGKTQEEEKGGIKGFAPVRGRRYSTSRPVVVNSPVTLEPERYGDDDYQYPLVRPRRVLSGRGGVVDRGAMGYKRLSTISVYEGMLSGSSNGSGDSGGGIYFPKLEDMKWNESHKKESISRFTETRVNDIIPKDEAVLGNVHPKKSDKRNTNIETLGLTIQVPQIEADQLHDFEDEQPILATSAYRHLIQIKASLDPTGKEELSEGEVRTPRGSGEGRKRSGSVHEIRQWWTPTKTTHGGKLPSVLFERQQKPPKKDKDEPAKHRHIHEEEGLSIDVSKAIGTNKKLTDSPSSSSSVTLSY